MNGTLHDQGSWTNGTIEVDLDSLDEGLFDFTLDLYDSVGNMVTATSEYTRQAVGHWFDGA